MKKDFTNVLLGYRDYNNDSMYGKDFHTLDSIVQWLADSPDRYTETTKEFYDFVEQEYGIDAVIEKMKEVFPKFPYGKDESQLESELRSWFANREENMKASEFENK